MNQDTTSTIGMDLGDSYSHICILVGTEEEPSETSRVRTTPEALTNFFGSRKKARVAIEASTQSAWVSELLTELGHEVIVANPRKLRAIYQNETKCDKVDAEMLARIARSDPRLLSPVKHRGPESQAALAVIRARDALVRTRTMLVNHVRAAAKSVGSRIRACSAESFHHRVDDLPVARRSELTPLMKVMRIVTATIKCYDKKVEALCRDAYPETQPLQAVNGVGALTSLAFVTTLESADRFARSRSVGAFLGLRSRLDQSSKRNPELPIAKTGNLYLRRLLVGSAQYILGPFGRDCDLRRWGQELMARGKKNAKKRAVVAVARKLAVLLHRLWTTGKPYESLRGAAKSELQQMPKANVGKDGLNGTQRTIDKREAV